MDTVIVLHHVTLIDGLGGEPVADANVAFRGDRIIYAGKAKAWQPSLEEDILNMDFAGKYVMPGMIDTHVHLCGSGEPDSRLDADAGSVTLAIQRNARRNLAAGVTTVRDLGGWNELEFAVRAAIRRGDFSGPRLVLAGRFISITESGMAHYPGMYRVADGVEEVRKAAREQIANGADLVKLGVTGAVLVEDGLPGATHLNLDEILVAVQEAAKLGRRVAAHAHGIDGIRKAVQAGVHTIEHGTYLYEGRDVIDEMARKGTFLVPTLKAGVDVIEGDISHVPAWIVQKMRDTQEAAEKSMKLAYKAGVPIAMGSDAATPLNFHGQNPGEIYLMHKAGMKTMDALVSATANAAKALSMEDKIGTIEPGKYADLLLLDADPLADLRRLNDKKVLRAVFLGGKMVARQPSDVYPRTVLATDCMAVGQ